MKSIPFGENTSKLPRYPAIIDNNRTIFGSNAVCRHLVSKYGTNREVGSVKVENFLDILEFQVEPLISNKKGNLIIHCNIICF
jgi:glutathione S-transferase